MIDIVRTGALLQAVEGCRGSPRPVVLDFSRRNILSPLEIAVLTMLKLDRNRLDLQTAIDWPTVSGPARKELARWGVDELFGSRAYPWVGDTIPLLHQPGSDPRSLVAYIDRHVIPALNMGQALAKETRRSFCEIFNNVFQHSESPIGGVAVSRVYPKAKRFLLCVADLGVGLVSRVQSAGHGMEGAPEAFQWALTRGNSTRGGPEPPGLGLYLLKEFVAVNEGVLRLFANSAVYAQVAGAIAHGVLPASFPGTLIELRLYVDDDVVYDLSYEG